MPTNPIVHILEQICALAFQNVSHFIAHLLSVTTRNSCVTCHTRHGGMTDFRPILGNPVEVAHITSPETVYISHAKGTYFPLARISTMIPP